MTSEPNPSASELVKAHCEGCGGSRNHHVLYQHEEGCKDPDEYRWHSSYQIVKCVGCDAVRFRRYSTTEDSHWDGGPSVDVFPSPGKQTWRSKKELLSIPIAGEIYRETVVAIESNCNLLAAAGLRACVEAICKDKAIKARTLQEKIDGLAAAGLLTKPQGDLLHEARFLGNTALHELVAPSDNEIVLVVDIVETLMRAMYVLPGKVEELRKQREGKAEDRRASE